MAAVEAVLKLVPDLAVETVDSGCCGMAGAFGYGADTVDVSLKMAELSLLPAVRAAAADTLVVASGTSCRHQIMDGSGREPMDLTQAALAGAMGIQRKHVNELCNNRRTVTAATVLILARVLCNSPDFWLNIQRRSD